MFDPDFGDPVAEFDRRVRELVGRGVDRRVAVLRVARSDKQLHEAFLVATNPGARAERLIRERFKFERGELRED